MSEEPQLQYKGIVPPHTIKSVSVLDIHIPQVLQDAEYMFSLCAIKKGFAVAHAQINDDMPLRFFVTRDGHCIINPIILKQTKFLEPKKEGCLSFPEEEHVWTKRSRKCEAQYQLVKDGKLTDPIKQTFTNIQAQILQHEIDHFNGKTVYDS